MKKESDIGVKSILFLVIISLIFIIPLVMSGHVIQVAPTNASAFTINESKNLRINVSVWNNDSGINANITMINVTLTGNITFTAGTNGFNLSSDESNTYQNLTVNFVNTSRVLSWSNFTSGILPGKNTSYITFNITSPLAGTWSILVTTINGSANATATSTNITIQFNDTNVPSTVNLSVPSPLNNSLINTSTFTLNVSVNDTGTVDGINITLYYENGTLAKNVSDYLSNQTYFTYSFTSILPGVYYVNATVNDTSGNTNSSQTRLINVSYSTTTPATTTSDDTGGSGAVASTWSKTVIVNDADLASGYTKELKIKERAKVKVAGGTHYVGITKLTSSGITVEVSSTPQTANLAVGEEKKFDVDGDGKYDLSLKLNKITNNLADLTMKSISEEVTTPTTPSDTTTTPTTPSDTTTLSAEKDNKLWLWIVIVVVVLVLVGVGYEMNRRGKHKRKIKSVKIL